MYNNILKKISELRSTEVILYVTSERQNMGTQIAGDVIEIFHKQLEVLDNPKKITLILYTLGGNTLAAWNIANMIREYSDYFEVIVLNKARSAGTLISLSANKILMNNLSTLGPIDPSLTGPFNPTLPNTNPPIGLPVSVEDVKGYMDFARNESKIKKGKDTKEVYIKMSDTIHPLVIGSIYRSKEQIKMLAKKLLNFHSPKYKVFKKNKIINFLCSDSGSHDYTINKLEAKKLGLPIEDITQDLNFILSELLEVITNELEINNPYDPIKILNNNNGNPVQYNYKRGIISTINGGSWIYESNGILSVLNNNGRKIIDDKRLEEGWKK